MACDGWDFGKRKIAHLKRDVKEDAFEKVAALSEGMGD
jgi:hypothetical protein